MKILVCFPFSAAERGTLDAIARNHGGHAVAHADSPGEALAMAGDAEVVMGNLTPGLMLAAREAR